MTPLARFFARHLPAWMVAPALALTYGVMLTAMLLAWQPPGDAIIYIDIHG